MKVCKSGAIYKREDGARHHRPDEVRWSEELPGRMPIRVIYFNEGMLTAQKCTWCAHLLDQGWREPRCVDACPTGALTFGEESDLKEQISKAEI